MADTFELEAEYLHPEIGSRAFLRIDSGRVAVDIVAVRADPDRGQIVLTAGFPILQRTVEVRLEPTEIVDVELRTRYSS